MLGRFGVVMGGEDGSGCCGLNACCGNTGRSESALASTSVSYDARFYGRCLGLPFFWRSEGPPPVPELEPSR